MKPCQASCKADCCSLSLQGAQDTDLGPEKQREGSRDMYAHTCEAHTKGFQGRATQGLTSALAGL